MILVKEAGYSREIESGFCFVTYRRKINHKGKIKLLAAFL